MEARVRHRREWRVPWKVPRSPSISRHASSGEHEAEGRGAKADRISRRELRRPLELDAVEESAVGGAEVTEEEQAVTTLDLRRKGEVGGEGWRVRGQVGSEG